MATLNDLRLATLKAEGYGDHTNDAVNNWLAAATGQEGTTKDLWDALFDVENIDAGSFNDRQFTFFGLFGAVGETLNDIELNYWQNRFNDLP